MQQREAPLRIENLTDGDLHNWTNVRLNMGIIGDEQGDQIKRLFIDKLTGFSSLMIPEETNVSLNMFKHVNNQNFVVWDLASIQSLNNLDSYLQQIDFEKFDFFIIFRKDGFSSYDYTLGHELEKRGKKVYFVSIDFIKPQLKTEISPSDTDESTIQRITDEMRDKLRKENVYILSKDEFPKLNEDIIRDLSEEKMKAYVLTIEPLSKEIIQKKTEVLTERANSVSGLSSLFGNFLSMPGIAIIADLGLISTEIWFYRKQLGLNKETFENISKKTKNAYEKIFNILSKSKSGSFVVLNDIHSITGLLIKTLPLFIVSDITDIVKFMPAFRALLHGTVSYASTKYALIQILDEFSKIALDIQNLVSSQQAVAPVSLEDSNIAAQQNVSVPI